MEIPFDIIADTEFTNAAPGSGLASFVLARPPTFYLETLSPPTPAQGTEPMRHWKQCADWTEGQQATKVLRHELVGSAVQLAHVLRHLNAHTSGSDIQLYSPSYVNHDTSPALLQDFRGSYIPPMFSDYSGSAVSHNMQTAPQTPLDRGTGAYTPHGQSRPYSAGSSVDFVHTPLATPSPPILTTPFYPAGPTGSSTSRSRESLDPPLPLVSGVPGVTYHADNYPQRRDHRFDY